MLPDATSAPQGPLNFPPAAQTIRVQPQGTLPTLVVTPDVPVSRGCCDSICGLIERIMSGIIDGSFKYFIDKPIYLITNASTFLNELARDIFEVFYRLLIGPEFDPTSPHFIEQINELNVQAIRLNDQLRVIRDKMPPGHKVLEALNELTQYHIELRTAYDRAVRYYNAIRRCNDLPNQNDLESAISPVYRSLHDTCVGLSEVTHQNQRHFDGRFQEMLQGLTRAGEKLPKDFIRSFREYLWALDRAFNEGVFGLDVSTLTSWQNRARINLEGYIGELETGPVITNLPPDAPAPVRNVGNSCYINSVLQMFLAIEGIDQILNTPLIRRPNENDLEYWRREEIRRELHVFSQYHPWENQTTRAPATLTPLEITLLASGKDGGRVNRNISSDSTATRHPSPEHLVRDLIFMSNRPEHERRQVEGVKTDVLWLRHNRRQQFDALPEEQQQEYVDYVNSMTEYRTALSESRRNNTDAPFEPFAPTGGEFSLANLGRQMDSATILEMFIMDILSGSGSFTQGTRTTVQEYPGVEFIGRRQQTSKLQVRLIPSELGDNPESVQDLEAKVLIRQNNQLANQIRRSFETELRENDEDRRFDPYDEESARILDPTQQLPDPQNPPAMTNYAIETKFYDLPDTLSLQIERLGMGAKNTMKVYLPRDGIVDLTEYQGDDIEAGQVRPHALYRIVGYNEHQGNANHGHYIAHVKKNGHYYTCSDDHIREISEAQFYGNEQAYLVMLKRLTPQEVANELERRAAEEAARIGREADAAERAAARNPAQLPQQEQPVVPPAAD